MIVKVESLTSMDEFKGSSVEQLKMKLDAIESLVRSHTHNNFQNKNIRIEAAIVNGVIQGYNQHMKVGDTVQISQSSVNDGLYTIAKISNSTIAIDGDIYDYPANTITKVFYPPDVQKGVIDLMLWERDNRQKVGIKSESISRYSVTYYDQDAGNQVMGYPISLLGFLKPYMKARF